MDPKELSVEATGFSVVVVVDVVVDLVGTPTGRFILADVLGLLLLPKDLDSSLGSADTFLLESSLTTELTCLPSDKAESLSESLLSLVTVEALLAAST